MEADTPSHKNGADLGQRALNPLESTPADPLGLARMLCARRLAGDLLGAHAVLQQMAKDQPDHALIQLELGRLASEVGDQTGAIAASTSAVEMEPRNPQAWRSLGDQLTRAGRKGEARDAYIKSFALALAEMQTRDAAAANGNDAALLRQLERHPTDVCSALAAAELAIARHRLDEAERRLNEILAISPSFALARYLVATALHRQTKAREAIEQLDILLAQEPENVASLNLKALSLSHLGEYVQSLACYERLLKQAPGVATFWVAYGHVLKTVGRIEDAVTAYRKAIALQPTSGEAYWQLADLKTFRFTPSDAQSMRRALGSGRINNSNAAQIHFALGKALEDDKDYARAFQEYARGNAVRRQMVNYSADAFSSLVRRSLTLFSETFFRDREGNGAPSHDPIFIVGLTRSGSTLVEQILASHPAVEGTAELPTINALVVELRQRRSGEDYPDVLASLDAQERERLGEKYLERTRIHRKTERPLFIDKMPGNFHHLGFIHLILPHARILDARRHPLACGFANFKQHFTHGQPWSYDLTDIGRYYRDYVALMAHFDAVLPGRVHRVIYEELVADPEHQTRRLLDYCGLPFDPACLRFYENKRPVLTASAVQVRKPIFNDALEQWRNFETWLGPLKQALGDVLPSYPDAPPSMTEAST